MIAAAAAAFYLSAHGSGLSTARAEALGRGACNDRRQIADVLAQKYGEVPVAAGVTNGGGLIELFSAPRGGTWTLVVTTAEGVSCLVAAGEGWRPRAPAPPGRDL